MEATTFPNFQKCGEILIDINTKDKKNQIYIFHCTLCNVECDQIKKFSLHIGEEHLKEFENILTENELKVEAEPEKLQIETFTIIEKMEKTSETPLSAAQFPECVVKQELIENCEDETIICDKETVECAASVSASCNSRAKEKSDISVASGASSNFMFDSDTDDEFQYVDQAPNKKRKLNIERKDNTLLKQMANTNENSSDEPKDGECNVPTSEPIANNSNDIKSKVSSGEYKVIPKRGRSKVWNVFQRIETDRGVEIPGFLICSKCTNIYKHNKMTTSNLVKHKCYVTAELENVSVTPKVVADNATKKTAVDIFTKWVVGNCRPFKVVSDSGLKGIAEFFISVGAKVGTNIDIPTFIPDPTTILCNIELLYKNKFREIKSEISAIVDIGYGLTSDLWTDNYMKKSYLALTIHFVKNGSIYCRLLGMKAMNNERNTSQSVHAKIVELLSEFGCALDNKTTMVTDRSTNMVSEFRPYHHLFCINHLLQNTIKKSMDEVEEIFDMCSTSSKLVRYFKKSGNNSNFTTSLKSYSPTRWNTFYYVFGSIKDNWNEINQILQQKNELYRLGDLNVSHISCLIEVLQVFEETLKKLEGEKYPTLHLVIVYIDKLLRTCAISDSDIPLISIFKEKIIFYLNNLVLENLKIFHKVALFLFPPANKLFQFKDEEKLAIKKATIEIMSEFSDNNQLSTTRLSQSNSELFGRFVSQQNQTNSLDAVVEELSMYENTIIHFHDNFDALKWWDTNKNQFPLLYKTSLRILAIPASSASSERVFSAARSLLTDKRSALGGNTENVSQIMFLNYNI